MCTRDCVRTLLLFSFQYWMDWIELNVCPFDRPTGKSKHFDTHWHFTVFWYHSKQWIWMNEWMKFLLFTPKWLCKCLEFQKQLKQKQQQQPALKTISSVAHTHTVHTITNNTISGETIFFFTFGRVHSQNPFNWWMKPNTTDNYEKHRYHQHTVMVMVMMKIPTDKSTDRPTLTKSKRRCNHQRRNVYINLIYSCAFVVFGMVQFGSMPVNSSLFMMIFTVCECVWVNVCATLPLYFVFYYFIFWQKNVLPKTVLAVSVHKIFLHWSTSNHQRAKMYLFLNKQTKNTVFVSFLLFFLLCFGVTFFVFTTHLHTHKTPFFILHQMFLFRLCLVGLIEQQQKKPALKTARWTTTTTNAKTVYIVNKRFFMVSLPRCDGMVVVFFLSSILLLNKLRLWKISSKSQRHFVPFNVCEMKFFFYQSAEIQCIGILSINSTSVCAMLRIHRFPKEELAEWICVPDTYTHIRTHVYSFTHSLIHVNYMQT